MTYVQCNQQGKTDSAGIEWHVAVYLRLSKEDGDKPESDSVQNQRKIIENYLNDLKTQGEVIASVAEYSDDGYSGGGFDRPAYCRMIDDIEGGRINCVIFKDNSRLGRNYPELGKLMEEYFPQRHVRVISVLNRLDSYKDAYSYSSAIVSFSNIMNDDYIRQLSIKIKSTFAMKRKRGEFLGNYAPYGYEKSPEDHHKLIVDHEAAEVVQMIFQWYIEGMSVSSIVKQLNALQIAPPSVYKARKGYKGFLTHASGGMKRNMWTPTTVNTILKDEVYIGNLVQGKYKSISYRTKRMVPADESEWTVVEGTHEPIITNEEFAIVHERFSRHTRAAPHRSSPHLLSGYVRCGCCGGKMNRCVSQGVARYRCTTRTYDPTKCQCPSVKEAYLEKVILDVIKIELNTIQDKTAVMDAARRYHSVPLSEKFHDSAKTKAERERERLKQAKFELYDRLQRGIISKNEYSDFSTRYDKEIETQNQYLEQIEKEITRIERTGNQGDKFVSYYAEHGNIQALDRRVLNYLLDHVEIVDIAHIDIFFRFSGS